MRVVTFLADRLAGGVLHGVSTGWTRGVRAERAVSGGGGSHGDQLVVSSESHDSRH
jgi:hypothetical protein